MPRNLGNSLEETALIVMRLMEVPLSLTTVQFAVATRNTHAKEPTGNRVPGEKSGIPTPGFGRTELLALL